MRRARRLGEGQGDLWTISPAKYLSSRVFLKVGDVLTKGVAQPSQLRSTRVSAARVDASRAPKRRTASPLSMNATTATRANEFLIRNITRMPGSSRKKVGGGTRSPPGHAGEPGNGVRLKPHGSTAAWIARNVAPYRHSQLRATSCFYGNDPEVGTQERKR